MRFGKGPASGQSDIEFILLAVVLLVCVGYLFTVLLDGMNGRDSADIELTQTGTIEGKYIDSTGYGKSYYVTVRNGSHQADHEVSLAEYNAAQVGADFPIVLTDSDSVKADEAQEQADNDQAQASENQDRQFTSWWIMNDQMLRNMGTSGE